MAFTGHDTGVVDVTADELREFMRVHTEQDLLLIDVRQPEEYAQEHVPGSVLVPLMELEQHADELSQSPEKHKVFICRSGNRSMHAAVQLAHGLGIPNVYNLKQGMNGWRGTKLPDFPNIKAFGEQGSVSDLLLQAMNLEKGADNLYRALLRYFEGRPIARTLATLAEAEGAHGRAVYGALKRLGEQHLEAFETVYDNLKGDIIEGGASFDDVLRVASSAAQHGTPALLELALGMELKAYDLFRNLAHHAKDDAQRAAFLDLAAQEKSHARAVAKLIGEAAAA